MGHQLRQWDSWNGWSLSPLGYWSSERLAKACSHGCGRVPRSQREGNPQCTGLAQYSACITFAIVSVPKASHRVKVRFAVGRSSNKVDTKIRLNVQRFCWGETPMKRNGEGAGKGRKNYQSPVQVWPWVMGREKKVGTRVSTCSAIWGCSARLLGSSPVQVSHQRGPVSPRSGPALVSLSCSLCANSVMDFRAQQLGFLVN